MPSYRIRIADLAPHKRFHPNPAHNPKGANKEPCNGCVSVRHVWFSCSVYNIHGNGSHMQHTSLHSRTNTHKHTHTHTHTHLPKGPGNKGYPVRIDGKSCISMNLETPKTKKSCSWQRFATESCMNSGGTNTSHSSSSWQLSRRRDGPRAKRATTNQQKPM